MWQFESGTCLIISISDTTTISSKDTLCILVRCQWFDKMAIFHILGMIYADRKPAKVNSVLATLFFIGHKCDWWQILIKVWAGDWKWWGGESPVCFCSSKSVVFFFCFFGWERWKNKRNHLVQKRHIPHRSAVWSTKEREGVSLLLLLNMLTIPLV